MPTAAVLIIGDEILSGKFADENGPFLIRRLRELGVDLKRVVVLPDEEAQIAEEVRAASARYSYVLTTGGVGPTHDDVTFPAIALAFGRKLVREQDLGRRLAERLGARFNEAAWRMAELPEAAQLWWEPDMYWPVVVVDNVLIFPGVPMLMRMSFEAVSARLQAEPVSVRRITTLQTEPEIADTLTEASQHWPTVAIGSYPRYDQKPWTVILTMESRDLGALDACERWLQARIVATCPS